MKKLLILAALLGAALQAPAAQAQSRFDKAKERAKAKARAAPDWFETEQQRAAREARERGALEIELKKNYGAHLDRAADVAKTYYAIAGDDLFVYQGRSLIHIKDQSVRTAKFSFNFTRSQDYSAANIANNGIVHSVRLDYYIDLKKPSVNFLKRRFEASERLPGERWIAGQWGRWSGVSFWNDHMPTLFSVNLYRYADGFIEIEVPQEFRDRQRWDISKVEKYIKNGDPSVHIAPLNCEWYDEDLDPYACISWHSRSQASAPRTELRPTSEGELQSAAQTFGPEAEGPTDPGVSRAIAQSLGIQVMAITPGIVGSLDVPTGTEGAVIAAVDPNTDAARKGLRRGDVVLSANYQPVVSIENLAAQIKAAKSENREAILLRVQRGTQLPAFVAVRLR